MDAVQLPKDNYGDSGFARMTKWESELDSKM